MMGAATGAVRLHPSHLLPMPPWRGCLICTHGQGSAAQRVCMAPAVAGTRRAGVPVDDARANAGACGPEAAHLAFPGLHD